MKYLYVQLGYEWEDMILFSTREEAIQSSIKYPKRRVEIFKKTETGYLPNYCYYLDGKLIEPL